MNRTNIHAVPHLVKWNWPVSVWHRKPVPILGEGVIFYFCKKNPVKLIYSLNSVVKTLVKLYEKKSQV